MIMWRISEMAGILKKHAMEYSYDSFKNRKTAAAICADLLVSYEERHIIIMLFREGLGECLQDAPYSTGYALSLAQNRVRNFARRFGLESQIVDNVAELIGVFADAAAVGKSMSISEVFQIQRDKDQDFETKRKQRISIERKNDFTELVSSTTEVLSISSQYEGETVPSLKSFDRLREFSTFYPLDASRLSEINLHTMCKLVFSCTDATEDITIKAPILEELTLSIRNNEYEQLTPLEKMVRESNPVLHLQAPRIKRLELSHFSGFDLSAIGNLFDLEVLIIRYTELTDLHWLKGCKSLKKLHIYSEISDIGVIPALESLQELHLDYAGIESIDDIALFPNLQVLNLRGNKIRNISCCDRLNHVKRVDLSRNPIAETTEPCGLTAPELVLTDADRELYSFDRKIEEVFRRAYQAYKSREKNIATLPPFVQRSWTKKTEEEKYLDMVTWQFESSFYSYNPTSVWAREYDTNIKKQYLEFVRERYPFISVKSDYEKQIQSEVFGISHFHTESPGNVIYLNQSLYIIRVKLLQGASGIDISFANTSGDRSVKANIEKLIKEKFGYIDLSQTKIAILIFDLFHTDQMDGVDFAVLAALHCLVNELSLPANIFICGAYNKKGLYKKEKILTRQLLLAKKQGAKHICYLTSGKSEKAEENNITIDYCNTFEELQQSVIDHK